MSYDFRVTIGQLREILNDAEKAVSSGVKKLTFSVSVPISPIAEKFDGGFLKGIIDLDTERKMRDENGYG